MSIERIFTKKEGFYDIPCMATYVGSVEIAGEYITYTEQVAVLVTVRGETKDEAMEKFIFGGEPEMLTIFARNPLNRHAIRGQNEQVAVLVTVRGETKDEAMEKFIFGGEPEMLTIFARNPLNRHAIRGQNPLKMDIFNTNCEDIPLQDESQLAFLEGSLEVI